MSEHYTLHQGRLIVHKASGLPGFVKFIFVVILLGIAGGGGFYYAWKQYAQPPNTHIISIEDYHNYLDIERTLRATLEQNIARKDYVLDHGKLKKIFNQVFPQVRIDEALKDTYIASVSKWGAEYSIPPLLILSIIWRESFFDASTHSSANARGPMQVIYKYHDEKLKRIGKGEMDLHEVDTGIRVGTEIMREYFDRFDQDIFKTMKAYVGGTHKTYAQDILTRYFRARMLAEEARGKTELSTGELAKAE